MIYGIVALSIVLLVALYLYTSVRPGIKSIRGGIQLLLRYGNDKAEVCFIHPKTNKALRFRKEIVGGIPTIILSVKDLLLTNDEFANFKELVAKHNFRTRALKSRKFVLLGSSIDRANDFVEAVLADVFGMSKYVRFRFEDRGINMN